MQIRNILQTRRPGPCAATLQPRTGTRRRRSLCPSAAGCASLEPSRPAGEGSARTATVTHIAGGATGPGPAP
eukprot:11206982-Lingulodinium_polyedra.AAC.1